MGPGSATEQIKKSLQYKYPDLNFEDSPIKGTYGLVWLSRDSQTGNSLAFKTLDFEREDVNPETADLAYLQREFRKWMKIPPSRNVVRARGYDLVDVVVDGRNIRDVPVMRMKAMIGSLEDWIGNQSFCWEERLVASIQMFLGLEDLYEQDSKGMEI